MLLTAASHHRAHGEAFHARAGVVGTASTTIVYMQQAAAVPFRTVPPARGEEMEMPQCCY